MDAQQDLFRYMSFRRFEEMIHSKTISANNPAKWSDQYELYWKDKLNISEGRQQLSDYLKGKVLDKDINWYEKTTSIILDLLYKRVCAICFSKNGDQEVMWRANSECDSTVMIKTSVDKLLNLKGNNDFDFVLREIKYEEDEKFNIEFFLNKISIPFDRNIGIEDIDDLFFVKRERFDYEEEARLLVKQMDLNDIKDRVSLVIPDLTSFIEGVMVHPLANDSRVETVKILCEYYGIPFLGQSQIYKISES